MNIKIILVQVALALVCLAGCSSKSTPTERAVATAFPRVSPVHGRCREVSSYLSVLNNGRYALVVGNISSIEPLLDTISFGDSNELVSAESCEGYIHPSLNIRLNSVESNIKTLGNGAEVAVAFPFEFAERWTPQPVVDKRGRLMWLNNRNESDWIDFSADIRIALLVSKANDGTLIAYEGWLAEIDKEGLVQMIFADDCEIVTDESTELALLGAARDLTVNSTDIRITPSISETYLYSFCGSE